MRSWVGQPVGALYESEERCRFRLWAPKLERVTLELVAPEPRAVELARAGHGYWEALVDGVAPGAHYTYRVDDGARYPDPASRLQPEGVHGPSEVIDLAGFEWTDQGWSVPPLDELVIYELHVGTFTPEGTFEAIIPRLGYLKNLGVNAIELMPIAQFPGERNWGYDGVFPYAAQRSYGGPAGLARLVDACHREGVAVVLDVVYNHLGPEGNYLGIFGDYFTDKYQTPWGAAINMDGPGSDGVRNYFVENALYWLEALHIDAFRLDAVHAIFDMSSIQFLRQLAEAVHRRAAHLGRRAHVIAESDLNDPRVVLPPALGGYGLDAQWSDDFQHAVESELIGERSVYYPDFGTFHDLVRAMRQAYVYTGQYSVRRQRRFGAPPRDARADQFVVFIQNHDQVGNRALGERLSRLVGFPQRKVAAATYLLSPFVPMLFMGEEYAEPHPFLYFVSHGDPALVAAVRQGRREEFAFREHVEPPDPQAVETFEESKLQLNLHTEGEHGALFRLYQDLLRLRRELPALAHLSKDDLEVMPRAPERVLLVHRWLGQQGALLALSFSDQEQTVRLGLPAGRWVKRLDAHDERYGGPGASGAESFEVADDGDLTLTLAPWSVLVYAQAEEHDGHGEP